MWIRVRMKNMGLSETLLIPTEYYNKACEIIEQNRSIATCLKSKLYSMLVS